MEEKYCITYNTTRILDQLYDFNGFKVLLSSNYGLLRTGDVISIDMLLRMYDDLYKQVNGEK